MINSGLCILGIVKWYDPVQGFGFVQSQGFEHDVLIHVNVLRNYGINSVAEGASVVIEIQQTDRGYQAVRVVSVTPPDTGHLAPLGELTDITQTQLDALPLVPGRVKWFNVLKGFGFANEYGRKADIFIHVEILRRSALSTLEPGEAVSLKVIEGERGPMAVLISSWDEASRSDGDIDEPAIALEQSDQRAAKLL